MNEEGQIDEGTPTQGPGQGSRAQQGQPPSQRPQQNRPPAQQRARPREDFLKRLTNNDGLAKFLTIGFVLLLVGMLLTHAAPFITNYGSDTPDDPETVQDDEAMKNNLQYTGNLIRDIGVFFISIFLILGSIHRTGLATKYRISLLGLGLLLTLVAWFDFLAPLIGSSG